MGRGFSFGARINFGRVAIAGALDSQPAGMHLGGDGADPHLLAQFRGIQQEAGDAQGRSWGFGAAGTGPAARAPTRAP